MKFSDLYENIPYLETVVKETGYTDLRSLWFLSSLVWNMAPHRIIELGSGYGCSAIFMACRLWENSKVISVDDYRGDTSGSIEKTQSNIDKCKMTDRVRLVQGDSRDVLKMYGRAELAFMDASHNSNDLYAELAVLQPNLERDYILLLDDIFSVDLDRFTFNLIKNKMYPFVTVVDFHNGMAIFTTNLSKYGSSILTAINEANHV